jgi:hypothetical protein
LDDIARRSKIDPVTAETADENAASGPGTQPGPCAELAATEDSVSWIGRHHRRYRIHL